MRLLSAGLAIALTATAAGLSCRQVAGITDAPPTDLTSTACGLPYGTTTCASCVQARCCAESSACAGDTLFCAPYEGCLGACDGDPTCRATCTQAHPVADRNATQVSALGACVASQCATACGVPCGGFAGYLATPDAAASCQSCIEKGATCADALACGTSAECDAFWRCRLTCTTVDCEGACLESHDAGAALMRPLYRDFSGTCAGACGYGENWSCVGHTTWPSGAPGTVQLTWWVYDYANQVGVSDASVSVCNGCPCSADMAQLGSGTTDANGYFSIPFHQFLSPTGEGASICVQVTAAGYDTTYDYFNDPVSQPVYSIKDQLAPPVAFGIPMSAPAAQEMYYGAYGIPFDGGRSTVGAGVWDCVGSPAAGVDVSVDGPDAGVFAIGSSSDSPSTVQAMGGRVTFLNVPPGPFTVTATLPDAGKVVSQVQVNVAPSTLTVFNLAPSP